MEVTIERILPGGLGLAHADGKTLMVALAAPGDRLRVRVDRTKGNVSFASIEEILEASPARVEPPCPYFGRCGGCDFQQLNYEAQLAAKIEIVKDCLHRIGGLADVPAIEIVAAANQWHYRARAQWQYDAEGKSLGYFESGSRRVCDVVECGVLVPELQNTLEELRARIADGSGPPDARYFRAIAGDDGVSISPSVGSLTIRAGGRDLHRSIHGATYALNAESFFQTNMDLLPQLIDAAIGRASGESAIELYSGVGLFTVPLARRFNTVIAVEGDRAAGELARRNLSDAGWQNAKVVNQGVAEWLAKYPDARRSKARERNRPAGIEPSAATQLTNAGEPLALQSQAGARQIDFLLLDPPRTGAESRVIGGILNLKPKHICYVSCDPATLARDLKKLIAGGYSLGSLVAFDMFPQTHHVETVVHLSA